MRAASAIAADCDRQRLIRDHSDTAYFDSTGSEGTLSSH